MSLTDKQIKFVDYYIKSGNASEAARNAGYSKGSVATANKWINPKNPQFKPELYAAIKQRLDELKSERTASISEVLEFYTSLLRGEIMEDVVVNVGIGRGRSEPQIVPKQASARDRLEAGKALEKSLGRFMDLEEEEQRLKIEKLRAEVATMKDTDDERVVIVDDVPVENETEK